MLILGNQCQSARIGSTGCEGMVRIFGNLSRANGMSDRQSSLWGLPVVDFCRGNESTVAYGVESTDTVKRNLAWKMPGSSVHTPDSSAFIVALQLMEPDVNARVLRKVEKDGATWYDAFSRQQQVFLQRLIENAVRTVQQPSGARNDERNDPSSPPSQLKLVRDGLDRCANRSRGSRFMRQ